MHVVNKSQSATSSPLPQKHCRDVGPLISFGANEECRYDVAHAVHNTPYFLINNCDGSPLTIHEWDVGSVNGMWVNLLSLSPRTCTCPCPRRTRTPWESLCRTLGPRVPCVPGRGPTVLDLCAPNRTADRSYCSCFGITTTKQQQPPPGPCWHLLLKNARKWAPLFSLFFLYQFSFFLFSSKNLYIQLCCRSCFYIHTFQ